MAYFLYIRVFSRCDWLQTGLSKALSFVDFPISLLSNLPTMSKISEITSIKQHLHFTLQRKLESMGNISNLFNVYNLHLIWNLGAVLISFWLVLGALEKQLGERDTVSNSCLMYCNQDWYFSWMSM